MKKKLLSITPHLSTGGAPQVLVKRIELIRDVYDIYVVEYSNISSRFIIQKNRLKNLLENDHFFTLGGNKYEIIDIISNINPDIIHFEEIPEIFMDKFIANKIYNKDRKYKIFETTHSSDFNIDNKIFAPDKFVFVSAYNCFRFNKFDIPHEVIEYPVDVKERSADTISKSKEILNLDPDYKHVLNVGLFTPRKNQAYMFRIARELINEKIKFHFVGNQADNFKTYWEPLLKNKPDNCIIWGERDDVDNFYKGCDTFLFTSRGFRFDKELNPLVIKEALEYQIPLFLFPLDVYCGKYDDNKLVHYLSGDIKKDSDMIKDFLNTQQQDVTQNNDSSYKIKTIHVKGQHDTDIDLKNYNLNYKTYSTDNVCKDCNDVSLLKYVLQNDFNDEDFIVFINDNCKLNKGVTNKDLSDIILKSLDIMNRHSIQILSTGSKNYYGNISKDKIKLHDVDWIKVTDTISQAELIVINKNIKQFLLDNIDNIETDDLPTFINKLTTNTENRVSVTTKQFTSPIEFKTKIKSENINITLDRDDNNKIKILTVNYKGTEDVKIILYDKHKDILYSTTTKISSEFVRWVTLNDINKYDKIIVDILDMNDNLISSDTIKLTDKLDNVFLISAYADTSVKEKVTMNCVSSLKNSKYDTILVSHIPVSTTIQSKVNYYVYDSFNPLMEHSYYNRFHKETQSERIEMHLDSLLNNKSLNQSLTVLNNINNGAQIAKIAGYKRIIGTSYDFIFSEDDISKIENICKELDKTGKRGYFMQYKDNEFDVYKSVFFIIDVDFYFDVISNGNMTPEEFNAECSKINSHNFLEHYLYNKLHEHSDKLLIENTTEENLFNGEINIFSGVEYVSILPVKDRPNSFAIVIITSNKHDNRRLYIDEYNDDNKVNSYDYSINKKEYIYKIFNVDDNETKKIHVYTTDGVSNQIINSYVFDDMTTDNLLDKISKNGILEVKKERKMTISTVINYDPLNSSNLIKCIDSVKNISDTINICLSDNISKEDAENLQSVYDKIDKDKINIIQYQYDENADTSKDDRYWDNISRSVGIKYANGDYVLLINSNENIIDSNLEIVINNLDKYEKAYIFSGTDSPLLAYRATIKLNGDRYSSFKNITEDGIDLESKFKIKLYEKYEQ